MFQTSSKSVVTVFTLSHELFVSGELRCSSGFGQRALVGEKCSHCSEEEEEEEVVGGRAAMEDAGGVRFTHTWE